MAKRIEELASILGVELDEVFDIYVPSQGRGGEWNITNGKITKDGFSIRELNSDGTPCSYWEAPASSKSRNLLISILTDDNIKIVKRPFTPSVGDEYWFVDKDGDIYCTHIYNSTVKFGIPVQDLCMIKLGNCYRSKEEAELHKTYWKTVLNSEKWVIDAWNKNDIKIKCDFESIHDSAASHASVNANDYTIEVNC